MGFWDGSASRLPTRGKGDWEDFARLQPDSRMVVLRHELAPYFQVTQAGANLSVWFDGGRATPLLTLTPPTVADQQRDLRHVRTAADLRAERIGEIVAQQGDMLSFYGSVFYLHPDRKKWTLVLMSALYEAVIVPEMRLKLFSSSPRPMEFSTLVQPIIATPSHSAYPSGHATEAFAFAGLLALLELVAKGVTDPVATLTAALKGPAKALEMLPFRLAARIADNRTIAGVHFPVDSAHGALLGVGCASAFYALGAPVTDDTCDLCGQGGRLERILRSGSLVCRTEGQVADCGQSKNRGSSGGGLQLACAAVGACRCRMEDGFSTVTDGRLFRR